MGKLIPFLIFPLHLFAIVNIAVLDFSEESEGFSGEVELAFNSSFGNSQEEEYEFQTQLTHFSEKSYWLLKGSFSYRVNYIDNIDDYEETVNKSFWHLRNVRKVSENTAFELFGQTQHNQFNSIQLRALGGAGFRFRLFDSGLYIGLSPMFVHEEYTRTALNSFDTYRLNSYLAYQLKIGERDSFSLQGYYQPRFEDQNDFDAIASGQYRHKITENLFFSIKADYKYDSTPVKAIKKYDFEQKSSLVYRF
jgi:hypothetical protein